MIRAAIVGLGRWGRNLVEASHGHDRLKVIRAVEPDLESARAFCAAHHLDLIGDLDAVLADGTIEAVLLATPHSLHPAQVIACAAAKKQVFCEKPLALRRADAARMFGACRDTDASGHRCARCGTSSRAANSAPSFTSKAITATRTRKPSPVDGACRRRSRPAAD
jgi:predicted dehydrogenase